MTGQLKIYTLGGSRFLLDGDDFRQFSTRKVEALAIFLASSRRPQPREVLADLLWDDRSQTRALSNLRVALTNLRKHLGSYFTITRDTAALNPEADVWLDVAELESVLAEGQASGDESTRDGLAQIEAAVALYQGEFLQGFSVRKSRHFEEWVTVERERLHYLVTAGLSQAVEGHLARGDYAAGIRQATRWLQLDPLNEAGYRGLMRLLAYDGQVGAALRQYQACVQVLDDEMGLLPSPETVELYEAIQSQQLTPPEKTTIVVTIEEELRPKPGEPPFKGLAYYDVDDAPLFFGREALIARLAGRLAHDRFLAVVGASGSGKSSLVRAGLLPALRNGQPLADGLSRPRGSEMWPVYLITPTARPLKALALSLTRGAASARATTLLMDDLAREPRSLDICVEKLLTESPAQRLLLVVDQFEELFTQCRDEEKRRAFVDNLLNAAMGNPDGPTSVVVTLRADFYAQCARYDRLRELLETQQLYIGQMTDGELRRAIEGPAAAAGWTFEPGLVDLLLHDAGAGRNRKPEPGALPLLSHALLETWRRRRGREMTFAGYAETGGVRGAIARTAEAVFNEELTAEQQPIARSIFLRLTELGEGAQDTRRRATLAELIPRSEDAPAVEAVLKTLADARLVTTGEEGVEVAHEALIREWPRLGEWLAEDREGLRLHRHLTEAAQGWEALQRDEGALYRGARLAQAGEWAQSHGDELNPLERNFLEASQELARREEAEREAQRQRELEAARTLAAAEKRRAEEQARASEQLRKGRRTLVGALVVASVLAVVAIFLGFRFRQSAAEAALQSRLAQARELASYSLEVLEADPQLNLLLAIEAVNRTLPSDGFVTSEAEVALYRALAGRELGVLSGHTGAIYAVTFSPDDGRIVTAGEDGLARVWDSAGNLITTLEGHTGTVTTATFSPDGAYILTGSDDGTARLWDAEGSLITVVEANDFVNSASFSPDGQRIVTGGVNAQLWDTAGNLVATLGGHTKRVHSVVFSPKGKRIVTEMEDGRARLWDSGGNFIAALEGNDIAYSRHVSPVQRRNAANFSPDGERIVTGSAEGTALLWDADGNLITKLEGHRDRIWAASFSPSGTQIVTASEDGTARLWEANGEFIAALEGHAGRVWSAVFSPEGTRIATGSTDGTARLWDDAGNLIATYALHTDIVWPVAFSPDGRRIVTGSFDGTARLWDAAGFLMTRLIGHSDWVHLVAYHPGGQRILTASVDGTARLWDVTGKLLQTFNGHEGEIWSAAFNPDGSQIVTAGDDGTARLWDTSGALLTVLDGHDGAVRWVGFSPDGNRILTASDDGTARLWDTGGALLAVLEGHAGPVRWCSFSPDGDAILTVGHADVRPRLWDADGNSLVVLRGHKRPITGIAFSTDGQRIVTAGQDNTARLWDMKGNLLVTLEGHAHWVNSATFNPDGTRILTTSNDDTARLWDTEGNLIASLEGHTDDVLWAGFNQDGRRIATVSQDGQVRLWNGEGSFLAALRGHAGPVVSATFSPDGTQLVTASQDGNAIVWQVLSDVDVMLAEAEERVRRNLTTAECHTYLHSEQCS